MSDNDWLIGDKRQTIAAERIYQAAADLIARNGLAAFNINTLATHTHCSRATIYRIAGGKTQIRDAVLVQAAARIIDTVRPAIDNLSGPQRITPAIALALKEVRSDPVCRMIITSIPATNELAWVTKSPLVVDVATDLGGLADPDHDPYTAQWIIRVGSHCCTGPSRTATPNTRFYANSSHPHSPKTTHPKTLPPKTKTPKTRTTSRPNRVFRN